MDVRRAFPRPWPPRQRLDAASGVGLVVLMVVGALHAAAPQLASAAFDVGAVPGQAATATSSPPATARATAAPAAPRTVTPNATPIAAIAATAPAAATDPLAAWRRALATTASRPADVVAVGDSITEGYFAVDDASRWTSLLRADLQADHNPTGTPGGEGFIPAWHSVSSILGLGVLPQRWTSPSIALPLDRGFGLGRRARQLTAAAPWTSIAVDADRVWVVYTESPETGTMRIEVDGVATNIDTRAATTRSGRRWDSGPLGRGRHTIRVTATGAAPNAVLDGVMVFKGDGGAAANAGRGVRMWEGGHAGYKTSAFALDSKWADGLDLIAPDLVLIELGANDNFQGIAPSVFESHLRGVVRTVRQKASSAPSIAIVAIWPPTGTDVTRWNAYRAAMTAVAAAEGCALLDVGAPMAATTTLGLLSDTIHLTNAGAQRVTSLLDGLLAG